MAYEKRYPVLTENSSFSEVLDSVCERLQDKQIQYSVRRLREMDFRLEGLEKELSDFLLRRKSHAG
ncbi:MAG: hypothetical protein LBQ67_02860 [Treponema sp.]|jgi:hypothetical protein|nr:hypothetical protein [Treponema sp.]